LRGVGKDHQPVFGRTIWTGFDQLHGLFCIEGVGVTGFSALAYWLV
jgi:hypothetical protein